MSFIAEQAGGAGSTGKERVLDIKPSEVHQRVPLFIGKCTHLLCHRQQAS